MVDLHVDGITRRNVLFHWTEDSTRGLHEACFVFDRHGEKAPTVELLATPVVPEKLYEEKRMIKLGPENAGRIGKAKPPYLGQIVLLINKLIPAHIPQPCVINRVAHENQVDVITFHGREIIAVWYGQSEGEAAMGGTSYYAYPTERDY